MKRSRRALGEGRDQGRALGQDQDLERGRPRKARRLAEKVTGSVVTGVEDQGIPIRRALVLAPQQQQETLSMTSRPGGLLPRTARRAARVARRTETGTPTPGTLLSGGTARMTRTRGTQPQTESTAKFIFSGTIIPARP